MASKGHHFPVKALKVQEKVVSNINNRSTADDMGKLVVNTNMLLSDSETGLQMSLPLTEWKR